jgi:hypothetical protein
MAIGLLIVAFAGCGESSAPEAAAGRAGTTAGGVAEAGHAGDGATDGGGGKGGVAGRTGGTAGVTTGVGGTTGAAGSPELPALWGCELSSFGDGVCDCGCGAPDQDCDDTDSVDECENCHCTARCDPNKTWLCLALAPGWTCDSSRYGDGQDCDCGCGVVDVDCEDESVESCDVCRQEGSCAQAECPSSVAGDANALCIVPANWLCDAGLYGDDICHCGCGLIDPDCEGPEVEHCEFCPGSGCAYFSCSLVMPDDNALCTTAPNSWVCPADTYNDGLRCDCGCGFRDPDCGENSVETCDRCDAEGSCSRQPCPGTINPASTESCIQPDPPPEWTCSFFVYGDAEACECGCGVPDPDCRTSAIEECVYCGCGSSLCAGFVDPADTTKCLGPPDGWSCAPEAWADDNCDCGCGVFDPFCVYHASKYCQSCLGCADGDCARIDPVENSQCVAVPEAWTCSDDAYSGVACDCGCAVLDPACASANASDCEVCNAEGSCSDRTCTDPDSTIDPADNSRCQ